MADIGKRIKEKREQQGITQKELASKLGYKNKSTIAKIEAGANDIVQSKVVEFAKALNTSVAFLMGWSDEQISSGKGIKINGFQTTDASSNRILMGWPCIKK